MNQIDNNNSAQDNKTPLSHQTDVDGEKVRIERILIVDDDVRLRTLLQRFLEDKGYIVRTAHDGSEMDRLLERETFSLMVLDFMLPNETGLQICERLREQGTQMPIVMLTAKGSDTDRIDGLNAGADDYLSKPFNPNELLARIRAVLRRHTRDIPGAPSRLNYDVISFGDWKLDLATRTLSRNDENISLTTGEFAVLKAFAEHPREPLTRDKLMILARGREWGAMERSIDVQISRLRRMIEVDASHPRYIQTVWGTGYVFVPDHDA